APPAHRASRRRSASRSTTSRAAAWRARPRASIPLAWTGNYPRLPPSPSAELPQPRATILPPPQRLFSAHVMPGLRIIRHPDSARPCRGGGALAMGNSEGLHRAHQPPTAHAGALARDTGNPAAVLPFEPHPRNVFAPGGEPFRLTPFRVKEREVARLGVD